MAVAGLWMLAAVAIGMTLTGLPAWIVLVGVSLIASVIGIGGGAFDVSFVTGLASRLVGLFENDLLQALPLYVFMGAMLNRLPLADILFRAGSRVLGRTGAGAPLAGLGLSVLLAPMNGSVGASVSMLTRSVAPRLAAAGVPPPRAAALVGVASTLGVVVPPSLVLILLGDAMLRAHTEATNITQQAVRIINTQDVFRGALVPAALLLALIAGTVWAMHRKALRPQVLAPEPNRADFLTAGIAFVLILSLLGVVTLGYLYAVEAAAAGAVALFAYGLATRTLTRDALGAILADTMAITGALFALLVGATVFTLVLRAFGTDRWIVTAVTGIAGGATTVLVAVLAIIGLCAFVLDAFEMIFVVIPVVMPPLLVRVPDAAWVAVLVLLILQSSFLVPPFGYAVMMVRSGMGRELASGPFARAVLPYLAIQLVVLALVMAFPALVLRGAA
jgi:tripartite ATP-independent transporter DctM subunit